VTLQDSSFTGSWQTRIRITFWLIGICAGGFLTYTTRFYLNGDGINYIEMGEALRNGNWAGLVNLTESPGYAFLLGLGQILLDTNRSNELPLLKIVNFASFLVAMISCDAFLARMSKNWERIGVEGERPLPFFVISMLCYSVFLFAAINWVKLRLVAPEMMVLALVTVVASLILRIRDNPESYGNFFLLGLFSGIAYLFKSFFFPFSAVFFVLAAAVSGSFKKAVPRTIVAAVTMLIVSSVLIVPMSMSIGRFTYGEVGSFCYATLIAGTGIAEHPPQVLNKIPQVLFYVTDPFVPCTRPAGFDLCYWNLGIKPAVTLSALLTVVPGHVRDILWDSPWLFLLTGGWLLTHWRLGGLRFGNIFPPSTSFILLAVSMAGIGLYCLVHVEMRYLASFMFLGFTALFISARWNPANASVSRYAFIPSFVLTLTVLGFMGNTLADQTIRGLSVGARKPSFQEVYSDMVAVSRFLSDRGIEKDSQVGMIGLPLWYWGRLADIKITAEALDREQFLSATRDERARAINAMKAAGMRAVVGQGSEYADLSDEGWLPVENARHFYVSLLQ
jgi:hypothetical protein